MRRPPLLTLPVMAEGKPKPKPKPVAVPVKPPRGWVVGGVPEGQAWPPWTGVYPPGTIQNHQALPQFRSPIAHPGLILNLPGMFGA